MITPEDKAQAEKAAQELADTPPYPDPVVMAALGKVPGDKLYLAIRLLNVSNDIYALIPHFTGYDALQSELGTVAKALEDRARTMLALQAKTGCEQQ